MVRLTIDNKSVSIPEGSTILDAARKLGIDIPTMCHKENEKPFTSCMVCMVRDLETDRLLPACSAPAVRNMKISTNDESVQKARKDTLDLLLSEHVGNCEAPCTRTCAAYMNIPLMIHYIGEKQFDHALRIVKKNIALPAVLGRICPAPCEKVCNRKYHDEPVSICLLKRFVADVDLAGPDPYCPELQPDSDKTVAIIGAGPTGLSAAYYLRQKGHQAIIFDTHDQPGGLLRYGVPDDRLDKKVLDAELETILLPGIDFRKHHTLGQNISLEELRQGYDAVVLAIGELSAFDFGVSGPAMNSGKIEINHRTFETSLPGVFAGGNTVSTGHLAIRSLGHGKFMSVSVDQFLHREPVTGYKRTFNSQMGKMSPDEGRQFVQMAQDIRRREPAEADAGFSEAEAVEEASRCFRCDCRKAVSCKLRIYADEYGAEQQRFKTNPRKSFKILIDHELIMFEPGKCIKCGICVRIAEKAGEPLGLTFMGRGYETRVDIPFNEMLSSGLKKVARECAEACPTAAIALKDTFEEVEDVTE